MSIVHHGNLRFTRVHTACGLPKSYNDRTSVDLVTCVDCILAILRRHDKIHKPDGWKHKKYKLWLQRLDELNAKPEPIIDFQI